MVFLTVQRSLEATQAPSRDLETILPSSQPRLKAGKFHKFQPFDDLLRRRLQNFALSASLHWTGNLHKADDHPHILKLRSLQQRGSGEDTHGQDPPGGRRTFLPGRQITAALPPERITVTDAFLSVTTLMMWCFMLPRSSLRSRTSPSISSGRPNIKNMYGV